MSPGCKQALWRCAALLHHIDFGRVLPWLAFLPLPLGYALARLRGQLNALTGRDWRSMGLKFRHIRQQSMVAYEIGRASCRERVSSPV